jgi:membrane protein YqaA with SNARE-associated domain
MTQNSNSREKSTITVVKSWLSRNYIALAMFLLVLVITIALFIFRDQIIKLGNYGYLGMFLVSLFTNATLILPMPSILILIPLGATFNPLYIGMAAGIGGAFGEMTGYIAGYSGRGIWHDNKNYMKAVTWLKKWGMFIVFVFAALPMPIDLMGLASGNLRLPAWKFLLPCWLGKTVKYITMAYAGYLGWEAFISNETLRTSLIVYGIVIAGVIILFGLALLLENLDWKRQQKK